MALFSTAPPSRSKRQTPLIPPATPNARAALMQYLASRDCTLFSEQHAAVAWNRTHLDAVLAVDPNATLLRYLDARGDKFDNIPQLLHALQASAAASVAGVADIRAFLLSPFCTLFRGKAPRADALQTTDVAWLVESSGACHETLAYVEAFAAAGYRFGSLKELEQAVRHAHAQTQQTRASLCRHVRKVGCTLSNEETRTRILSAKAASRLDAVLISREQDTRDARARSGLDRLVRAGGGTVEETVQHLHTLYDQGVRVPVLKKLVATVRVLRRRTNRTRLFQYLANPSGECQLFSGVSQLRAAARELDKVVDAGGGDADETIAILQYLDQRGRKFASMRELVPAVTLRKREQSLEGTRKQVLEYVLAHGHALFCNVEGLRIKTTDIDRLLRVAHGATATIAVLEELCDLAEGLPWRKYESFAALIPVVQRQLDMHCKERRKVREWLMRPACTLFGRRDAAAAVAAENAQGGPDPEAPPRMGVSTRFVVTDAMIERLFAQALAGMQTLRVVQQLDARGKSYRTFDDFVAAVREQHRVERQERRAKREITRRQVNGDVTPLRDAMVPIDASIDAPDKEDDPKKEEGGQEMEEKAKRNAETHHNPVHPAAATPTVGAAHALAYGAKLTSRKLIVDFLLSPDCRLFENASRVKITELQIDSLLAVEGNRGGTVYGTLRRLQRLDERGRRVENFEELFRLFRRSRVRDRQRQAMHSQGALTWADVKDLDNAAMGEKPPASVIFRGSVELGGQQQDQQRRQRRLVPKDTDSDEGEQVTQGYHSARRLHARGRRNASPPKEAPPATTVDSDKRKLISVRELQRHGAPPYVVSSTGRKPKHKIQIARQVEKGAKDKKKRSNGRRMYRQDVPDTESEEDTSLRVQSGGGHYYVRRVNDTLSVSSENRASFQSSQPLDGRVGMVLPYLDRMRGGAGTARDAPIASPMRAPWVETYQLEFERKADRNTSSQYIGSTPRFLPPAPRPGAKRSGRRPRRADLSLSALTRGNGSLWSSAEEQKMEVLSRQAYLRSVLEDEEIDRNEALIEILDYITGGRCSVLVDDQISALREAELKRILAVCGDSSKRAVELLKHLDYAGAQFRSFHALIEGLAAYATQTDDMEDELRTRAARGEAEANEAERQSRALAEAEARSLPDAEEPQLDSDTDFEEPDVRPGYRKGDAPEDTIAVVVGPRDGVMETDVEPSRIESIAGEGGGLSEEEVTVEETETDEVRGAGKQDAHDTVQPTGDVEPTGVTMVSSEEKHPLVREATQEEEEEEEEEEPVKSTDAPSSREPFQEAKRPGLVQDVPEVQDDASVDALDTAPEETAESSTVAVEPVAPESEAKAAIEAVSPVLNPSEDAVSDVVGPMEAKEPVVESPAVTEPHVVEVSDKEVAAVPSETAEPTIVSATDAVAAVVAAVPDTKASPESEDVVVAPASAVVSEAKVVPQAAAEAMAAPVADSEAPTEEPVPAAVVKRERPVESAAAKNAAAAATAAAAAEAAAAAAREAEANTTAPTVEDAKDTIRLVVACRSLPHVESDGSNDAAPPHPCVGLYVSDGVGGEFAFAAQTESLSSTCDPDFATVLPLARGEGPEETRQLLFSIYHVQEAGVAPMGQLNAIRLSDLLSFGEDAAQLPLLDAEGGALGEAQLVVWCRS